MSSRTECWTRPNDTTIGLTVAGALTPAGLGGCVIELMERGLVDFVISTAANLYHDLHYALNFTLHRGSPFLDDVELHEDGVIRIYDILFPAQVLLETDAYVRDFSRSAGVRRTGVLGHAPLCARPGPDYPVPRVRAALGVASAAAAGVPIYTSSPGDSSIGMNLAAHDLLHGGGCAIDPSRDVNEVAAIILDGTRNGCLILGGGSPKNFYLQGQPTLWEIYGIPKGGCEYFVQITTDQVVWGGLSGPHRPRRSAGARSTPACCRTPWLPTATRRSPFRSSVSMSSGPNTAAHATTAGAPS